MSQLFPIVRLRSEALLLTDAFQQKVAILRLYNELRFAHYLCIKCTDAII